MEDMEVCDGDGYCLEQKKDGTYTRDKKLNILCKYRCAPIHCVNHVICKNKVPRWLLTCHEGICESCDFQFGKWINGNGNLFISDSVFCSVCNKNTATCLYPLCSHRSCAMCIQRLYTKIKEPEFPYNNRTKNRYLNDPNDIYWKDDVLIDKYNHEMALFKDKSNISSLVCKQC